MDKELEISINAKINALIQQRDIAQAAYVNLAAECEVMRWKLKIAEEQFPKIEDLDIKEKE